MFRALLAMTAVSLSQGSQAATPTITPKTEPAPMRMEAEITSVTEKNLKGDVLIEPMKEGIRVQAHFTGLEPNSKHGFHIHENGECAGPDYKSAGAHFNPDKHVHGSPESAMSHIGDFGNLVANEKGEAHVDKIIPHASSHVKEIAGKAILIHTKGDNLSTQPSGDSGGRLGCGIIKTL